MKDHLPKSLLLLSVGFLICCSVHAQNLPARIEIVVVEGEGITSGVRQRVAHNPVVRVEDDDHLPVGGAVVVFALPVSGTTGEFSNGSKTITVVTGKDGLATAHGLKTNDVPGKLQIYVSASFRGLNTRSLINQFVEAAPGVPQTAQMPAAKRGGKWKWALLGIAGSGGAGAGLYFGLHGKSTSLPTPISIGAGAVTFGSPH